MTNLVNLTINQLRSIISIKEQIESLQQQLGSILGGTSTGDAVGSKRRMSASGRARIIAAVKARWAREKGRGKPSVATPAKKKRDGRSSPAVRAKLAAAARARWAKAKAQGKSSL